MGLLISSFVILVAVAASNIIAKYIPGISRTYINLAVGVLVGLMPMTNHLVLGFNDNVFMILILAPLLFFEGQTTPLLTVRKKVKSIVGTAVILAVLSAVLVAIVIHKTFNLIIPVALIIVAISTPTDATAFDSVVEGRKISQPLKNNLKMESLFNDATGIILLQAATLWLSTGHLSLWGNVTAFLVSAIGGIVVGSILAFAFMAFRQYFVRSTNNVISSQTLIYILTPFCIYFLAEKLGVSGIIAVVSAGLVHNSEANRSRFSSPRQMHLGLQMINFANEVLNSFVFVVLGISLERIFFSRYNIMISSLKWLAVGIVVYVLLLGCRYVYARFFIGDKRRLTASLFALGGVHGTVTLAMTFSIGGDIARSTFHFIIIVETVVIILSMLVPTIVFKFVLPIDADEQNRADQLQRLRHEMVIVGINQVKSMTLTAEVSASVIYDLRDQTQKNTLKSFYRQWRAVTSNKAMLTGLQSVEERRALMHAFDAERQYLYTLAKRHMVSSDYVYEIYSEILLSESLVLDPKNQMI
ncbi:cation:proton antiporter [Loigolactobacillus backii]|uniref:Sodium:proton antiporter n=1 Tax=Loigolactobacillus backii TaxID=375175 RepID=A0A192H268_9LACO|nr:sodium:proton antiporter [Loigolactobacillus backii]ANK62373.1 sodium:proton antiporter [Loigolactobacillus backii]ANK70615.1 sodium:proton antiporter [Loigolactobacillus backii]MDA5387860.1 sodium:proton antiporter [Loigolactobacillus backii]MDA5390356.1 sodium:proton antiporter [Loigolactobacillus backii]PIO82846.1 sodium:proton antiporter [Loigolactobacillus backii]